MKLYVAEIAGRLGRGKGHGYEAGVETHQRYERKIDIFREATRILQKNMPLLPFAPMIVAVLLLVYELRKRK